MAMADRKDELAKTEFENYPNEYIEEEPVEPVEREDPDMVVSETEGEEGETTEI